MAAIVSNYVHWEVDPATGSSNASGGFDPSQTAGMFTDGSVTSGTTAAPVFSSSSYNFSSSDIGAWLYIALGTDWLPGWYSIVAKVGATVTLNAAAGQAVQSVNTASLGLTTVQGCVNSSYTSGTASATWTIDYSQQAAAQISFTDLVIQSTNTELASSGNPFAGQWVGNLIQVTGGTGFTTGWYVIKSVASNVATTDRAVGTASSTGGTGYMGGALASLTTLFTSSTSTTVAVAGHIVWTQGTSTISTGLTIVEPSTATGGLRISVRGYGTYRGDGVQATIQTSTNSVVLVTFTAVYGFEFQNIIFTNSAGTPGNAIAGTSNSSNQSFNIMLNNCVISDCVYGVTGYMELVMYSCEVKSCTSDGIHPNAKTLLIGCYFHNNSGHGVAYGNSNTNVVGGFYAYDCVSAFNTDGGFVDVGTNQSRSPFALIACDSYDNGQDGFYVQTENASINGACMIEIINCISYDNGRYGINFASPIGAGAAACTSILQINNAFGANTSARSSGAPVGINDITLTANPFVNPSGGNFKLNSNAGGGAACTGTGWQNTLVQ